MYQVLARIAGESGQESTRAELGCRGRVVMGRDEYDLLDRSLAMKDEDVELIL